MSERALRPRRSPTAAEGFIAFAQGGPAAVLGIRRTLARTSPLSLFLPHLNELTDHRVAASMAMTVKDINAYIEVEMRDVPVACRQGCSWCCHQLVVLTCRDDGRLIVAAARARMNVAEFAAFEMQVRAQAAAITRIGHEAAESGRWPCPLLRDNACVIYDVRPVACRSVFSPDADCCRAMMEADAYDDLTPTQQALATEIGARAFRLQVAINDRRPIDGPTELRQLLVELLDEEGGGAPDATRL